MVASFGSGHRHALRRLVENTLQVASPRHAGLVREAIVLRVGEAEQVVEVVRQPRHFGGQQGFWMCPKCAALRQHLYAVDGTLLCRVCGRLDYRSKHILHPAVIRAAKLRRKLGGAPGLLSPIPRKPPHWSPVHYWRLVGELRRQEAVLAKMLHGTVAALERRKNRVHGRR